MKINLYIQILLFSGVIVLLRYLFGKLSLDLPYVIDFVIFISIGLTAILNYRISNKKNRLEFYFTFGILQVIGSIILFEASKLIIFTLDISLEYIYKRLLVAAYIFILGLISNGIFLLFFCKNIKKSELEKRNLNVID